MSRNRRSISDLIKRAWKWNNPAGWFEAVYAGAAAGEGIVPWALMQPHPDLVAWLTENGIDGTGKTAIVVGAGLGDDAEALSERGFDVSAFDISETAIAQCKRRYPNSRVQYRVADVLNFPDQWRGGFDLVLEIHTIQALPHQFTETVIVNIAALAAKGGVVLVMCFAREPEADNRGIPWPLSRDDLAAFGRQGLIEMSFKDHQLDGIRRFCVAYQKIESST
jgi:2-polyprenyl-3-methyl-5-hydroxy-6-metoxy-1,4-benzoquinol methylase